jgi:hypothetical protein
MALNGTSLHRVAQPSSEVEAKSKYRSGRKVDKPWDGEMRNSSLHSTALKYT